MFKIKMIMYLVKRDCKTIFFNKMYKKKTINKNKMRRKVLDFPLKR